jgi:hypothetical protein
MALYIEPNRCHSGSPRQRVGNPTLENVAEEMLNGLFCHYEPPDQSRRDRSDSGLTRSILLPPRDFRQQSVRSKKEVRWSDSIKESQDNGSPRAIHCNVGSHCVDAGIEAGCVDPEHKGVTRDYFAKYDYDLQQVDSTESGAPFRPSCLHKNVVFDDDGNPIASVPGTPIPTLPPLPPLPSRRERFIPELCGIGINCGEDEEELREMCASKPYRRPSQPYDYSEDDEDNSLLLEENNYEIQGRATFKTRGRKSLPTPASSPPTETKSSPTKNNVNGSTLHEADWETTSNASSSLFRRILPRWKRNGSKHREAVSEEQAVLDPIERQRAEDNRKAEKASFLKASFLKDSKLRASQASTCEENNDWDDIVPVAPLLKTEISSQLPHRPAACQPTSNAAALYTVPKLEAAKRDPSPSRGRGRSDSLDKKEKPRRGFLKRRKRSKSPSLPGNSLVVLNALQDETDCERKSAIVAHRQGLNQTGLQQPLPMGKNPYQPSPANPSREELLLKRQQQKSASIPPNLISREHVDQQQPPIIQQQCNALAQPQLIHDSRFHPAHPLNRSVSGSNGNSHSLHATHKQLVGAVDDRTERMSFIAAHRQGFDEGISVATLAQSSRHDVPDCLDDQMERMSYITAHRKSFGDGSFHSAKTPSQMTLIHECQPLADYRGGIPSTGRHYSPHDQRISLEQPFKDKRKITRVEQKALKKLDREQRNEMRSVERLIRVRNPTQHLKTLGSSNPQNSAIFRKVDVPARSPSHQSSYQEPPLPFRPVENVDQTNPSQDPPVQTTGSFEKFEGEKPIETTWEERTRLAWERLRGSFTMESATEKSNEEAQLLRPPISNQSPSQQVRGILKIPSHEKRVTFGQDTEHIFDKAEENIPMQSENGSYVQNTGRLSTTMPQPLGMVDLTDQHGRVTMPSMYPQNLPPISSSKKTKKVFRGARIFSELFRKGKKRSSHSKMTKGSFQVNPMEIVNSLSTEITTPSISRSGDEYDMLGNTAMGYNVMHAV